MKFFKYSILILFCIGLVLSIFFYVSRTQKKENGIILSPLAPITKTSVFSLENAPTDALVGTIASMSGGIQWQSRTATVAATISAPITIQQGETVITGEKSTISVAFPAACSVFLSEKTKFDVIQTLPATIVFSQTSGTGMYTKTGSYPVSIRTTNSITENSGDITVLYSETKPTVTFTQTSGKSIIAYNDAQFLSHEVTIKSGQTFVFNYDTRKGVLK